MKKLIAALLILASAVSLASCSVNKRELTFEERQASLEARESERVAESLKQESLIVEDRNELEDEIGKTIKGERIVMKREMSTTYEYVVYEFDKSQKPKYRKLYYYYKDTSNYLDAKNLGDIEDEKLIDHDDEKRLLVYKVNKCPDLNFDQLYENLSGNGRYDIIE